MPASLVAAGVLAVEQVEAAGESVLWIEARPKEGRSALMRIDEGGEPVEISPPDFDARSRVHEYGGGALALADATPVLSRGTDSRLYLLPEGAPPVPLTRPGGLRFADGVFDAARERLICVREEPAEGGRPRRALVGIDLRRRDGSQDGLPLVTGSDFYAAPRLQPGGRLLAWVSWDHPDMPWTGSRLWLGEIALDGSVAGIRQIAGGPGESVLQPEWSPDGVLHFVSDRSGWWNLYRFRNGLVEALPPIEGEVGRPLTRLGLSSYAFESEERIVCAFCRRGVWRLATLAQGQAAWEELPLPYTDVHFLRARPGRAVFLGATPAEPPALIELDLRTLRTRALRRSPAGLEADRVSLPREVEIPTPGGAKVYAFFYPALGRPDGAPPPLLVSAHPGPTRVSTNALSLEVQFWTSRGVAVLDVNYGGSSGFGRDYRRRLDGAWGVVDVEDCRHAALHVIERGLADPQRVGILGGSAGGFTVLCALAAHGDLFRAGSCYCGLADLERLRSETHDFESSYLEHLVGPYPETRERYRQRSPLHAADRIDRPVAFFYGLEDRVTPPGQTEAMIASLEARGVPVVRLGVAGEGHGFRQAANLRRKLEMELDLFTRHLRLDI